MGWIKTYESNDRRVEIEDLDGMSWHEVPIPLKLHLCRPQTRGWSGLNFTERCACGAINMNSMGWSQKNSRKRNNG